MAKTPKEYEKLPGRGVRFDGVRMVAGRRIMSTLWLGPDHLLRVEQAGYTEEYRRFYYRDIQAIVIRKTETARTWNIVLGILIVVFGVCSMGASDSVVKSVFGGIAGVLAIILGTNFYLGPTCVASLKTAVQIEQLPPWRRMKTVRKSLERLRPRILEAQGSLAPEETKARVEAQIVTAATAPYASQQAYHPSGSGISRHVIKPYQGKVHRVLFILLLANTLSGGLQILTHSLVMTILGVLLSLMVAVWTILALIKQQRTDLSRIVRRLTVASACLVGFEYLSGTVVGVVLAGQHPESARNQLEMTRYYSELVSLDHPVILCLICLSAMASLTIGLAGWYYLGKFFEQRAAMDQLPPVIPPVIPPPPIPTEPPLSEPPLPPPSDSSLPPS